jgi:hypothetical protein
MARRRALAFLLAPMVVPAVFIAIMVVEEPSGFSAANTVRGLFVFGAFGFGAELLFGLPLELWFRRRGWQHVAAFAIAGAVIGGIVGVWLDVWAYHGMADRGFLLACVAAGLLSAVVFRIVRGWEPNIGVHPPAGAGPSR